MTRPELEELFSAWRAEPVPTSRPQGLGREGQLAVAAALREVAERKRRQRRQRNAGFVAAIAAGVFGLALGGWYGFGGVTSPLPMAELESVSEPQVRVDAREGEVTVIDGVGHLVDAASSLAEGYGLRTEQGTARLGFSSGATAQVAQRSILRVTTTRASETLRLSEGRVDVEVPKLEPQRGFSVETPDALVTVHGTRFSVKVESTREGPRTHVDVEHGVVSVTHAGREVRLTAGQSWPAEPKLEAPKPEVSEPPVAEPQPFEAPAALEQGNDTAKPAPLQRRSKKLRRGAGQRRAEIADELGSRELADQNRRFARAMQFKKNGATQAALDELTELERRYPASPLSQELRVERLRLLERNARGTEAADEARAYLRDFPGGYAAREAEEILAGRP